MSLLDRRSLLVLAGLGSGLAAAPAGAQRSWPSRSVRIVVPFPPSGTTDILARLIAAPLGQRIGQSVVVENRAGAGGTIGTELVAKSTDGHTLLMTTIGTAAINFALYRGRIGYAPSDLAAVSLVATVPNAIVARTGLEAATLGEVVALAKAKPGVLTYGHTGNGTSNHLVGELMKVEAGVDIVAVPFRGAGPMLIEAIAGRVDLGIDNLPSTLQHVQEGRLRALAVTGPARSAALPDVPTVAEAGFPGLEATAWFGVQAPASMPRGEVELLAREMRAIVADPSMRARIVQAGGDPVGDTPEAFEAFIAREIERWDGVVRRASIRVD